MEYDVFISYSREDKAAADAACAKLEQAGIRCWIAPRDIVPGTDWSESILDAIAGAKLMVLIFSEHANTSPQIKREVERSVNKGLPIIPVRIVDAVPSRALEYFISTPHWLDAFTPPLEERLVHLVAAVNALLKAGQAAPATANKPLPLIPPRRGIMGAFARVRESHRAVRAVGATLGAGLVAILGAMLAASSGLTQAALVILGATAVAVTATLAASLFVTSKEPRLRTISRAVAWGVSGVFFAFLAVAATAIGLRSPSTAASMLGIEDGMVCGKPSELLQAFACGAEDEGYVVANIRLDDADSGLMVREGPGVHTSGRTIPANGIGVTVTGECNPATPDSWCQVQCRRLSLSGWSRPRYLRPRTEALYTVSNTLPSDSDGLIVRSGPHEDCRTVGNIPPLTKDVIEHGCQRSPMAIASWCRVTYGGISGWVPDGFLEHQN